MSPKSKFSKPIKKQTLAEQVAETIRESILAGEWEKGEALPTEPEMGEQFGVSRAVVRDATRILMAQGLVEVRHGSGVYVTQSQQEAFGEALLLALRRAGASVWDVEQFEQLVLPEVAALAAVEASDEDLARIQEAMEAYLDHFQSFSQTWRDREEGEIPEQERDQLLAKHRAFMQAIFDATHNKLLMLLAPSLLRLRNVRMVAEPVLTVEELVAREKGFFQQTTEAVASRDPEQARTTLRRLLQLPPEAVEAMRRTEVGQAPRIPSL